MTSIELPHWVKTAGLSGDWPKITLVTPSLNQAKFLEQCLDSVLSQGYPNLEYIVMDGGSTDGSVSLLRKYEKHFTFWQSKPDGGHYKAIEAGFARASGEIMGYLNSDDMFHPKGLFAIGNVFRSLSNVNFITGLRIGFDAAGNKRKYGFEDQRWSREIFLDPENFLDPALMVMQEGTFWRRSLWQQAGACFNHEFSLAGDFELWARFFHFAQLYTVNFEIAGFRTHSGEQRSESQRIEYLRQCLSIIEREKKAPCSDFQRIAPPLIEGALSKPYIRSKRPKPKFSTQIKQYKTLPDVRYPKISIVTPSYNQAEYLEECIDSVLSQEWPNLEYIIIDGGSTDGSKEIIEKYSKYLTYHCSKQDKGQYFAIDEGFKRSSGEIMAWLNSDDKLHDRALHLVATFFQQHPQAEWVSGRPNGFNEDGQLDWILMFLPHYARSWYLRKIFVDPYIQQESVFWKRSLWTKAGGYIDTSWRFAADLELWARFFRHAPLWVLNMLLGGFRSNPSQRSSLYYHRYLREGHAILDNEFKLFIEGKYPAVIPAPDPVLRV